ncbi:MAG: hypothetical protein ACI9O3_000144 [Colwellia sp.]|jgi:hypothetical protein
MTLCNALRLIALRLLIFVNSCQLLADFIVKPDKFKIIYIRY